MSVKVIVGRCKHFVKYCTLLQETPFAPQGITIQGEINEQFYGDIDKAMKFYNNLLEAYPMSMLAEPVRMRMRQLKNVVES